MAQISEGNETSGRQKAKNDKLTVIKNKEKSKMLPEICYISVYKNGKLFVPYISKSSVDKLINRQEQYISEYPNDSITFSKIKML